MGRRQKNPPIIVNPITSKKQLMNIEAVRNFLGGMSEDAFKKLRDDTSERFPKPLQITGSSPMWSVEQVERYVAKKEKDSEKLSA